MVASPAPATSAVLDADGIRARVADVNGATILAADDAFGAFYGDDMAAARPATASVQGVAGLPQCRRRPGSR